MKLDYPDIADVSEIREEFDVEITVDALVPENFNSVQAIMALIEARRG